MSQAQPTASNDSAPASFEELRQLLGHDLVASAPVGDFDPKLTGLPRLKSWLAAVRGKSTPLKHPRLAFFTADSTSREIETLNNPQSSVCKLAAEINTDLQVYDLSAGVGQTTPDQALAYGMMAVQPGLDLLGVGLIGRHDGTETFTLENLLSDSRHDMAALVGAVIAARLARLPVVLHKEEGITVKKLLTAHHPQGADHLIFVTDIVTDTENLTRETALAVALGQLRTAALL